MKHKSLDKYLNKEIDISLPEKAEEKEPIKPIFYENPDQNTRTIFVGNLARHLFGKEGIDTIKQHFAQYGEIESLRQRSITVKANTYKEREYAIKKHLQSTNGTFFSYIVFVNEQDAINALNDNGKLFEGTHLRVDRMESNIEKPRSVFVGNVPYKYTPDDMRKVFERCGKIESIRLVMDKHTGRAKGFGYVTFVEKISVQMALRLNEKIMENDLVLRIKKCDSRKKNEFQGITTAKCPKKKEKRGKGKKEKKGREIDNKDK